jgi:hypothetical protein
MAKRRSSKRTRKHRGLRVFISYSHHDRQQVDVIAERLRTDGHEVWIDSLQLKPGDNISQRVHQGLATANAVVFVISSNSLHSEWVQQEFAAIALQQLSTSERRIIPIRLDDCEVPSYLADRLYIDFSADFVHGLEQLSHALKVHAAAAPAALPPATSPADSRSGHLAKLRECLRKGRLTLFCGAGVSVGAGIPGWNALLAKLLHSMMERLSKRHALDLGIKAETHFQQMNSASSLILGKYLKNNLGRDFVGEVRDALYSSNPKGCPLIDGIISLSRPQRDGRPLDSIVTFNFDCLVEENLSAARIENKAIFSEAISHDPNEIPVYHVHGYLPRAGAIAADTELVFSEDAYHSQFIDAFSWSNLIQLNKLTQNTCLFIGVSLTDPNMRRLLDVAWRKNPDKRLGHYIAKRLPRASAGEEALSEVSRLLEEQDANALGLNVIWMDEFDDLPGILEDIASPIA